MAFTDQQRTDVRRYCGYPAYGLGTSGFQNWRFYQAYGLLEFRLNYLSDAETTVVLNYLTQLQGLEAALPAAGNGLDTDKAGPFVRNGNEIAERTRLFDDWRRRLCGFLGIPPGPALGDGGVSLVV
jgi:hypothetical protein